MPGKWDTSMKRLLDEHPEHFVRWLLPEAEFKGKPVAKPTGLNNREIEADSLYEIVLLGILCLIHIEFQSYSDPTMAYRMWEYNASSTISYRCPTYSFLIYLKPCEVTQPYYQGPFPGRGVIHHFTFTVIKLWELTPEDLKRIGLVGLYPLIVLTDGGKSPAVVDEVVRTLEALEEKESRKELLTLTYILASLTFQNEIDRLWLKKRFHMFQDVLREAWAYQEIMEEGLQKGLQEGREEGLQKGREEERQRELQRQRQTLMTIVQARFPTLVELMQAQIASVTDPDVFQTLLLNVAAAQSEEQVRQALLGSDPRPEQP